MSISPAIATLLDRMDKFPDEFIDQQSDLTVEALGNSIRHTRWEGITFTMLGQISGKTPPLYTPEEVEAYMSRITPIYRKKLEEDICKALVEHKNAPRTHEQMELPLDELRFKALSRYNLTPEINK